jgi:hypothetical protein
LHEQVQDDAKNQGVTIFCNNKFFFWKQKKVGIKKKEKIE